MLFSAAQIHLFNGNGPNLQMVSDRDLILQINEFVKRARAAKIHAYIISHLRKEMPAMMGKAKTQQKLIDNLAEEFGKVQLSLFSKHVRSHDCLFHHAQIVEILIFFFLEQVQKEFHLPPGDFPNVEHFKEILSGYSFDKFEKLKPKMIQVVDDMLGYDIPDLLKNFRNPYDQESECGHRR